MIIVAGSFDLADADAVNDVIDATIPFQQATRNDEAGCRAYVLSADRCMPGRIQLYELWEDTTSLAAHFQHENYVKLLQSLGSMELAGTQSAKFRLTADEPLYDESRSPRADFVTSGRQFPDEAIIVAGAIEVGGDDVADDVIERSISAQVLTRSEPGCETYVFSRDPCERGRILVYELWSNEATLATHFKSDNIVSIGAVLREHAVSTSFHKFRSDHRESVYDGTGTPRADFDGLG